MFNHELGKYNYFLVFHSNCLGFILPFFMTSFPERKDIFKMMLKTFFKVGFPLSVKINTKKSRIDSYAGKYFEPMMIYIIVHQQNDFSKFYIFLNLL